MKLLRTVSGTVAFSVSGDEVVPPRSISSRELIDFVTQAYEFTVPPNIPAGVATFMVQNYIWQSGIIRIGDSTRPIFQLALVNNGDLITASDTDTADTALEDLMAKLDASFGFRFATARGRRFYQSSLIVQFDKAVEELLAPLKKIEALLARSITRPDAPFKTKRLAFGYGDPAFPIMRLTPEATRDSDFVIERRAGEPYSENRYFSAAPVRTSEHFAILESIEREL